MSFPNILSLILHINIIQLQSQYNYLCDFETNFISNDRGEWSFNAANCSVTQTNTDMLSTLSPNGAVAWMGGQSDTLFWTDYTIEATINAASYSGVVADAGIIFRVQADGVANNGGDVGRFYEAMLLYWNTYRVHLREYTNSGYTIKKQNNAASCSYNTDYVLRIEVTGYDIDVYLDNDLQFAITSYTYPAGSVGIRATNTEVTFKTLYITFPSTAPTTSTPTTYAPTTDIPTTFAPTTYPPATYIPTVTRTSLSTTKYETTSEPTTISTISTENEMKTSMNINNARNNGRNSILIIVTLAVIIVFVASVMTVLFRCYKNKRYVKKHEIAMQIEQMNKAHVDEEDSSHSHSVAQHGTKQGNVNTFDGYATKTDKGKPVNVNEFLSAVMIQSAQLMEIIAIEEKKREERKEEEEQEEGVNFDDMFVEVDNEGAYEPDEFHIINRVKARTAGGDSTTSGATVVTDDGNVNTY